MPTAKPKNGSAAYKKEILKNLAKKNAQTTEDLPTLSQPQIAKARKANKGNFAGNSRYIVKKDEGSAGMPPPSSRKRKTNRDDAAEPEDYLEAPEAKRQRTPPPYQTGVEKTLGAVGDDVDADADTDWEGADLYNAPPNSAALVKDQSQQLGPAQATGQFQDHYQNGLVLLFSTIVDREYALAVDKTFTTAAAVKRAQEEGFQLEWINAEWYRPNVPRYVNPDGSVVESVVHTDAFDQIVFPGGFNDDSQGAFEGSGAYNAPPSFSQNDGAVQGSGTYNATSPFAQDNGAFYDDSQNILQGNGAYDATSSFVQDDGTYDATSTFPYGDVPSDFNTFYDQHDFGGNPTPLPQIPTNPLPTLQTQPSGIQQSEGYETQPDIFEEIWQSLNSR